MISCQLVLSPRWQGLLLLIFLTAFVVFREGMAFSPEHQQPLAWQSTSGTAAGRERSRHRIFPCDSCLQLAMKDNNNDQEEDNDDNHGTENAPPPTMPTADLTRALVRLDRQWKLQQKLQPGWLSRWSQISIDGDDDDNDTSIESDPAPFLKVPAQPNYVYLLEPPNKALPSSVIVFCGGALLGQFPQVAYNELLIRLSDRLGAAVIAVPYTLSMDHFQLAKSVGELARKALIHCEEDVKLSYPTNLPTYLLGHSLGCKLMIIYMAATNQQFEGIGLMSFNNFAFSQTIAMAREFANQLGQVANTDYARERVPDDTAAASDSTRGIFNQLFAFAETAVSFLGLDFTPTSKEMDRIISLKYDQKQQDKTRMFCFDRDTMDNTQEMVQACQGTGPKVSSLPGTHLAPVYFQFGLNRLPEDVRELARSAAGDFQGASFGNEKELNALVDEVSNWILGKEPSKRPDWQNEPARLMPGSTPSSAE